MNGQLIYEAYLDQEFTVVNTQLFLEKRVKGIYFLRITTNSGIVTKKVIVH
ncbi:MAG: T9SS type A sorting domain-containing protein [Flavobacteriales bacterium]|nr:T9SS type A sorting domain-containing protein [Flavobacteriales bacterium]